MSTIAITGSSGKLGNATLSALLAHNLVPASSIVALTSSHPGSRTWTSLAAQDPSLQIRHARFEDPATLETALRGVDKLFLVSTPHVELDFEDADGAEKPDGQGREAHHRAAIDAAIKVGITHIYYSSLAFAWDARARAPAIQSKAGVMRAHLRTEAYLAALQHQAKVKVTVVREGLYNESWPLYLGYFDGVRDERDAGPVSGDGRMCWTAIKDLGIGSALILAAPGAEYEGRTLYLSTRPEHARSLAQIAGLVAKARGAELAAFRFAGGAECERYYVEERGRDRRVIRWWVGTYEAFEDGECEVDDPTLERLLRSVGVKSTPIEECIMEMVTKVDTYLAKGDGVSL
ncbi:NAD(P)-binding protein [Annulohypoxylon bovei var. microspora]|nr:NAD(P)-binding protein [Annulohypoxylon bovei var. microspora]